MIKAAWKGDLQEVKNLLQKGADWKYRDSDGFSALDRARDNGHQEIVKLLENAANKQ